MRRIMTRAVSSIRRPVANWLVVALLGLMCPADPSLSAAADPAQPDKWEATIKKFEEADAKAQPAPGGIVFVGSSSIRLWRLSEGFPDLPVINRGFGGSQLADSVRYADRIVTPYRPRVVVLYAGDNDIAAGKSPETIRDDYRNFVAAVRAKLPCTKIVFISIKPSPSRWKLADKAREANRLIREDQRCDRCQSFVDVWPDMLGADGQPRAELFVADKLHLSPAGYEIWTKLLRPCLATE
jgi:lysophospholipase L1-like esterase